MVPAIQPQEETSKQRRRRLLQEKMFELNRSAFTLSNREWQSRTGRLLNQQRLRKLVESKQMETPYSILATSSSRTGFAEAYLRHVEARIQTAPSMQAWMKIKMIRRWKFDAYQKEQRAVTKLVTSLLGGLRPSNTLIVWGNGGFGPTSRGHASAPNKKLQSLLAHHIPLAIGSEFRSSITSACHHGNVNPISCERRLRRHTVVQCQGTRLYRMRMQSRWSWVLLQRR